MSCKSLVCAGMLVALLVVPAAAQPSLSVDLVRDGGGLPVLSAAGNWQWAIHVVGDDAFDSALAVEIGIQLDTLTSLTPGDARFDTSNPGEAVGGLAGAFDYTGADATGFQVIGNEAYISVGSSVITDFSSPILLATLEAGPPSTAGSLSTTIDILGAWASATTLGSSAIVAQEVSAGNVMTATVSLSITKTATPGDADLDGDVDGTDLSAIVQNFDPLGNNNNIWSDGNFDRSANTNVDGTDLSAIVQNFNPLGTGITPPGSGSGSAVPEPASALMMLMGAALAAFAGRRR